jgi:hypothetical protein
VKIGSNKLIIIFSELIIINIFIIINLLLNQKPTQPEFFQTQSYRTQPKIGFGEILAKTFPEPQVLAVVENTDSEQSPLSAVKPMKDHYVIAVIGDSMVETMGENLDYLQVELKRKYPNTRFTMYNYGIGAEKVTGGLERLGMAFNKGGRHYPPIPDLKPDILIVGSYAYNPFDLHDPEKHKNQLAELINSARGVTKVYMLAEIAPVGSGFGTGPGGVNWPVELAKIHVQKIQEQMQNVFEISQELHVPIVDVYNSSKIHGSNFGKPEFVSTHDHIHPSILGQIFTARFMANVIELD